MEWIARIADLAKVPKRLFAVLAITSGLLLFLPVSWLNAMSLFQLTNAYAPYIGIVFVLSAALLVVEFGIYLYREIGHHRREKAAEVHIQDYMFELDDAEKSVLREFFIAGAKSIRLPLEQPAVAALLRNGVLVQIANSGSRTSVGSVFSVSLSKPANNLLSPELLDLTPYVIHTDDGKWDVNEEGESWLMSSRPSFISELERHFALREHRRW